jgi:hypothetical protein
MSSSSASTSASISTTNKDPQQSGYYGSYYSLTFEVKFKCKTVIQFKHEILDEMDTVYFAHCYPYTYSDLCDLI